MKMGMVARKGVFFFKKFKEVLLVMFFPQALAVLAVELCEMDSCGP